MIVHHLSTKWHALDTAKRPEPWYQVQAAKMLAACCNGGFITQINKANRTTSTISHTCSQKGTNSKRGVGTTREMARRRWCCLQAYFPGTIVDTRHDKQRTHVRLAKAAIGGGISSDAAIGGGISSEGDRSNGSGTSPWCEVDGGAISQDRCVHSEDHAVHRCRRFVVDVDNAVGTQELGMAHKFICCSFSRLVKQVRIEGRLSAFPQRNRGMGRIQ
jgi:hypothetical protein